MSFLTKTRKTHLLVTAHYVNPNSQNLRNSAFSDTARACLIMISNFNSPALAMHPPARGLMRKLGVWKRLAPELSEKANYFDFLVGDY